MYGSHTSRSAHTRGWRSPLRVSVTVGPWASSTTAAPAVLLDVSQRQLPHLIIRDRDTHKYVGIEYLFDIGRHDRVHEAHLPLDPAVVFDITQLDDVPLVGVRRYTGSVDIREGPEDLLDRTLVLAGGRVISGRSCRQHPAEPTGQPPYTTRIRTSQTAHRHESRSGREGSDLAPQPCDSPRSSCHSHEHLRHLPPSHYAMRGQLHCQSCRLYCNGPWSPVTAPLIRLPLRGRPHSVFSQLPSSSWR